MKQQTLIFEKSQEGHHAYSLPIDEVCWIHFEPDASYARKVPIDLSEVSEMDLTRHFCGLSKNNMGIDSHFYPLGSCTMKLNPRINEYAASLPAFVRTHPLAPEETVQGNLRLIYELIQLLCEICGMSGGTLAPNAGSQ
jgi:glycine dehydrogenase subunit 2